MEYINYKYYGEKTKTEEGMLQRHPLIAYITVLFAVPVAMIGAVSAFTCVVVFPIALMMGWV